MLLAFVFFGVQAQQPDSLPSDTSVLVNKKKLSVAPRQPNNKVVVMDSLVVTDSLALAKSKKKRHSPTKAALLSAALPGLGQGYNKKYWKIPIVYAGFGGLGYALYYTTSEFYGYRNAYRLQVDEDATTQGSYRGYQNAAELKIQRDYYKRYLDISAICTAVWYTLNIIDAAVDAHLFEWNMKDDIKMGWQPSLISPGYQYPQAGLGVNLRVSF
ncbi:MAG: hypothetical protein IPN22_12870 [Bacteroidetes bacterium]|nr:hypothetical protein [Bacteroidota bacterium]